MNRRDFLLHAGRMATAFAIRGSPMSAGAFVQTDTDLITLALCGDVMTGRGIDQVMPQPSEPRLYEPYVRNAKRYVELAEAENGPIAKPVPPAYIWGDALAELDRRRPDVRIVNLETAITTSNDYWPGKGINYRMHPDNIACLTTARLDCCALANNHTLDWGYPGLTETLVTLERAGLRYAGAGRDREEAERPVSVPLSGGRRVLVLSVGVITSGIPAAWAAVKDRPGVSLLSSLSEDAVAALAARIECVRQTGDVVVLSIHWGSNWGHEIPRVEQWFAHRMIDEAAVDLVHGHSSHHPKGIEVYRDRAILFGCGDFLNDYEGIGGHEEYRGDLALLYFVTLRVASGALAGLEMVPFQIRRFQLRDASLEDTAWLQGTLSRACGSLGTSVGTAKSGALKLRW